MLKEHPLGYRSPREILECAGITPDSIAADEEVKQKYEMEILGSSANPNSLFKHALPSLKIKFESTEGGADKLDPEQRLQLERKRSELAAALNRDKEPKSAADVRAPQGQGSSAQAKSENNGSSDELLEAASSRQPLQLSKQTSLVSATDVQYQRLLALTH